MRQLRTFKAELSDLLIGTLFLLLVSRLDLRLFASEGPRLILVVLVVMLIVRPLNILFSTVGAGLGWKERAFLGWVAPRGIVAASMASLFALQLSQDERFQEEAMLLEMFTYSVICGTVVVQGLSAGWMAKWLGLNRPPAKGWLIVGANRMGRSLASELMRQGGEIMIMDVNQRNVQSAVEEGIPAIHGDARDVDTWETDERFGAFGHLLALTDNAGLNQLLASTWAPLLGRKVVYAWNSGRHKAEVADRFASLPRPSVLSEEIRTGAAAFVVANQAAMPQAVALFGITPDGIKAVSDDPFPEETPHLFLVRSGGYLDRAIERGSRIRVSCDSLNALNELLIEEALRCEPRLSREQLRSDLLAQEKLMPPFLGHGVAAPHAFSTQVARRICVCAELSPPLEIPNLDEPVHTAYCIISPAGDPEGHLATLAEIAKKHYDSGGGRIDRLPNLVDKPVSDCVLDMTNENSRHKGRPPKDPSMKTLSILIPVFNEEGTIARLIEAVRRVDIGEVRKEIVVVDDGSSDGTLAALEKVPDIVLLRHGKNRGKGAAIRTAIGQATGDVIIIQDADMEYDPGDYPSLIQPILNGQAKVVYGSRRLRKTNKQHSGIFFFFGGVGLTWLTNFLYPGARITDEPTCYKTFDGDLLRSIPLKCDRFEFCPEVTAKVLKRGHRIVEVPISYFPRHSDEGKKIKLRDGIEAIWTLLKYRFVD